MVHVDCSKINLLVIDVDGVLTDGTLVIDKTGEKMFKKFHTRDVRAIRELVSSGWEVLLMTADDWPGSYLFAEKTGAIIEVMREKKIIDKKYIAVGDDAWDVQLLKNAEYKFCPRDADRSVKIIPGLIVLQTDGGKGVIAELIHMLL